MSALFLIQVAAVAVTATVDRDRAPIGDQIVYTLRAVTALPGPFRVELPELGGLEVVERTERLDPVVGTTPPSRAYQLELTLRAAEVGRWRYGPVLVFVGASTEVAPDVEVVVTATSNVDANRNPRLVELIQGVPPPNPGANATLAIVVSSPRLFQGDQLDVLTAAWFPRSLRARLRRPPTLKPPVLAGVWAVPQPALPGIVASRAIGEEVYDLFVSHQVAFPLTAGPLTIPPARLEYAVPMTRRASGDERPVEAASAPVRVDVVAPGGVAPAGFRGPQGRSLLVGYRIRALPAHAGEVLPVEVTVAGEGNLAFWPPPNILWPPGTRAYLDRVTEASRPQAGRLGGVKTFHFLLLPDSVGSVALPPIGYDYFDTERGEYQSAAGNGLVLPVLAGRQGGTPRERPGLVAARNDWPWVVGRMGPGSIPWRFGIAVPIVLGLLAIVRRFRSGRRRIRAAPPPQGVAGLERLLVGLVADQDRGHQERLEGSLRRHGIAAPVAAELAELKRRLDEHRFAPTGWDDQSLGSAATAALARLPSRIRQQAGLLGVTLLAVGIVTAVESVGASQSTESPERLYRDGAASAAAAGFRARAAQEPGRWQHWYDAGAALFMAGRDAEAAAAVDRALAVAPRARAPLALWTTLERQYEPLRAARHQPWSAAEQGLAGLALCWLAGGLLLWRPRRLRVPAGLAALGLLVIVARPGWHPEAFTNRDVRLLRSPHGLAPDQGRLGTLTPVTIEARRPGWVLVADRPGNRGWVAGDAVARAEGEP